MTIRVNAFTAASAFLSECSGGVSTGPYSSLNLGLHVGDRPEHVQENRKRFASDTGLPAVYMNQTHSCRVEFAKAFTEMPVDADGIVTDSREFSLAVMTADCLPLLLAASDGSCAAAVHCGWKGVYGKIASEAIRLMRTVTDAPLEAYIGPCIRQRSYEVDAVFRDRFIEQNPENASAFLSKENGRFLCSLPELVKKELAAAGVTRIADDDLDTFSDPRFFSYRRNKVTGRIASAVHL